MDFSSGKVLHYKTDVSKRVIALDRVFRLGTNAGGGGRPGNESRSELSASSHDDVLGVVNCRAAMIRQLIPRPA